RPFIERVVHGRNVPTQRIDQVVEQYKQIGGKSPFNELTFKQASVLEKRLAGSEKVYVGMLYSEPFIKETISKIANDDVKNIIGLIMAPQRTEASFDRYKERVAEAIGGLSNKTITVDFVDAWYTHPLFISAISERIESSVSSFNRAERTNIKV